MRSMFKGCSKQFQNKIKVQYKNIKKEAFDKYEKYKHNCVKHWILISK